MFANSNWYDKKKTKPLANPFKGKKKKKIIAKRTPVCLDIVYQEGFILTHFFFIFGLPWPSSVC